MSATSVPIAAPKRKSVRSLLGHLCIALATAAPLAAQAYHATDLGTVPGATFVTPAALNGHGMVVGTVQYSSAWNSAFVWTPTSGLQVLPPPPGHAASEPNTAMHVNDAGTVVGYVGLTTHHAWLWHNGQYTMIGMPPGSTTSQAWRINNAGEILGIVGNALQIDNFVRTAAGVMTDPTPGYYGPMYDLNDAGQACGSDLTFGVTVWDLHQGTRQSFGYLPGYADAAVGTAIDASGQVVGYSWDSFASGFSLDHAFVLEPGQPLLDISGAAGRRLAKSVNSSGRVVGVDRNNQNQFIGGWTWTAQTGVVDLIALLAAPSPWSSVSFPGETADALNELGQIIAVARATNGTPHALLLSPAAWSTPLGDGCPGSLGASVLTALTPARIGATLTLHVDRVPLAAAAFVLGLSTVSSPVGALPWDMAPIGAPRCLLRTDPAAFVSATGFGHEASWSYAVPDDAAMIGLSFHAQGLLLDPAANALGCVLSSATTIVVGP